MAASLSPRKKSVKLQTRLAITEDDEKVLGRTTTLRRDKAVNSEKLQTLKLKTQNSAWTPLVNKPSNEQIFKERRDLVSHWYDVWTDSQRKRFLDVIFKQCSRSQYSFVQRWFSENMALQHLDFTTVLPRFLSCYIFSFLEPKSLCRCAQVSWHWKFLSEQEVVWLPKCVRLGWFLPYTPADNEYGAWKRHYIACIHTLDYHITRSRSNSLDRNMHSRHYQNKSPINTGRMSRVDSRRLMDIRPPWQGPDFKPKDLIKTSLVAISDQNPNDPLRPTSDLIFHNKFGIRRTVPENTLATKSLDFEIGMDSSGRREKHRMLLAGEDYQLPRANKSTLKDHITAANLEERRLQDLVNTDWMPPTASVMKSFRPSAQKKHALQLGGNFTSTNPRVIILSSRIPAAELLLDAVLFGVLPVVYEYEGTTAQSIVQQVESVLEGRNAQSIGLFCHYDEPSELQLAHGCTVSLVSLADEEDSESRDFFEALVNHILPVEMGGQFDIFVPLATSEEGMEMMVQLSVLTSMQFSSPTGLIGVYNHINTEWLIPYENNKQPPGMYFSQTKLNVWANVADQVSEAVKETRAMMDPYFDKIHRDISAQITGQLVFDVLGQTDIQGVSDITDVLRDGLKALGEANASHPLKFLGRYLLERAGVSTDNMGLTTKSLGSLSQLLSNSLESDETKHEQQNGDVTSRTENGERDLHEDITEEDDSSREKTNHEHEAENLKDSLQEKDEQSQGKKTLKTMTMDLSIRYGTMRASKSQRLTPQQYADHPEKRTPIAFEILTSETEYMRTLKSVQDVYVKPLKSAIASNRSIISGQNVQIIFTDIMNIFKISRELEEDLRNKLADWDAQHTCVGDVFVRFCTKLKAYTNFTNNYEVILRAIERCKEQTPAFRAFLQRHERVPETRMLMLQEIFLLPIRRISEYVQLLTWFELHTPRTHPDRQDLANVINTLTELDRGMRECKVRMSREKELVSLTRKIINCPALLEANRYLVNHIDVAHLRPPTDSEVPEFRAFQEIAMLGLYLFNDALLITRRTSKHFPFSRAVEFTYKYETSMSLNRMKVLDIPDSKYVKNAFKVETPKQAWTCATETAEQKFNWVSILAKTIRGSIERK
ncbi:epithelial cell-transforming sequence 2 oncogene-like [Physella acuta]|uniref:epithelial cell-transforming sequence 2 oncogene-like n=1 Tax=Physella acuta TaxID=109671 RepID=UPI0027DB889E|nr:epithelial cell-transforming sequence 2 oncogene-like [Physella acuta]XP_059150155.1 epithelial cell-transforming sequence 2 oncogene-like [Physella acuta]XP_059150156.1 epithelial cell-transforming sequence 2 oncogene-like [Physella acuta]XP_059150157.1 epithelial cell-transforming sequence 2 oncogene-like [Physella acuta]